MNDFRGWMVVCAVALCAIAMGCDDGGSTAAGNNGESCTRASDCGSGLACVNNVCVADDELSGGGATGADGSMGDPVTETRGEAGESCGSRGDCQAELACIDSVCVELGSEPRSANPGEAGSRGESCSSHDDCIGGLGCYAGRCQQADLGLSVTGKVCEQVQCEATADCCAAFVPSYPAANCQMFQQECALDPLSSSCLVYDANCACSRTCVDTVCIEACEDDSECPDFCVDGRCVGCRTTTDCVNDVLFYREGYVCRDGGVCGPPVCVRDEQCRFDERCVDNACVFSGECTTDLQCKDAAFGPSAQRAECVDNGCVTPCEADGECGDLQKCDEGACRDLGCTDDDECRQLLNIQLNAGWLARCVEP